MHNVNKCAKPNIHEVLARFFALHLAEAIFPVKKFTCPHFYRPLAFQSEPLKNSFAVVVSEK